jgi:hypothetical protein
MTFGSIKNTNKHNRGEDINNDLRDVSCQRRKYSCNRPNSSLPTITESNYILKLQCLFKKDIFATKYGKEKIIC